MIEGKLEEMGKEPRNVQVTIGAGSDERMIRLCNEDGTFLEASLEPKATGDEHGHQLDDEPIRSEESDDNVVEQLRQELAESKDDCGQLTTELEATRERLDTTLGELEETKAQVTTLTEEKDSLTAKVRMIWRPNCDQLAQYDVECAEKDAEIASLRRRVEQLEMALSGTGLDVAAVPHIPSAEPPVAPRPVAVPASSTLSAAGIAVSSAPLSAPSVLPNVMSSIATAQLLHPTAVAVVSSAVRPGDQEETLPAATGDSVAPSGDNSVSAAVVESPPLSRRGKAPPVDPFTGDDVEVRLEDWLPTLERASSWNGWSEDERLMQLAGHLRGRALQEWNLLTKEDRASYGLAVGALRERLDPGSQALAQQDFRHAIQAESECVADYIRRLERLFQIAYGRGGMKSETREALLHSQLQEGLKYSLMKSPAVSGAQTYKQLCLSAKQEEKRVMELKRRHLYQQEVQHTKKVQEARKSSSSKFTVPKSNPPHGGSGVRRCYKCGSTAHLARDCKKPKSESTPSQQRGSSRSSEASANMVTAHEDPIDFLLPDVNDGNVRLVQVEDRGSKPRKVMIDLQGVPAEGIIDSGADITIIGPELFKKVAAVARLTKSMFKKPDKVPYTYNHQQFHLDGRIDLDVGFNGRRMRTPVYVKMDAGNPLLLSEGVCSQLGIISYHPLVFPGRQEAEQQTQAQVPTVRVRLVQSLRLPPLQNTMAVVRVEDGWNFQGPLLLEPLGDDKNEDGLVVSPSLVQLSSDNHAQVLITNPTGWTQKMKRGTHIGEASEIMCTDTEVTSEANVGVLRLSSCEVRERKQKLG